MNRRPPPRFTFHRWYGEHEGKTCAVCSEGLDGHGSAWEAWDNVNDEGWLVCTLDCCDQITEHGGLPQ